MTSFRSRGPGWNFLVMIEFVPYPCSLSLFLILMLVHLPGILAIHYGMVLNLLLVRDSEGEIIKHGLESVVKTKKGGLFLKKREKTTIGIEK